MSAMFEDYGAQGPAYDGMFAGDSLRPLPPSAQLVHGDSPAWVEWWDDGWHPFDLGHHQEPGDPYVSGPPAATTAT
jgi:hypothetical protein